MDTAFHLTNLHFSRARVQSRRAFTLVELVVVLAIVGILIGLLIPAVQSARESARRIDCRSNLHQVGIALHSYHDAHRMFPPRALGFSLNVAILPHLEQGALAGDIDFSASASAGAGNRQVRATCISIYSCPSDASALQRTADDGLASNYAGNFGTGVQRYGYNGLFHSVQPVRASDVTDGLSSTAALSEILVSDGSLGALRTNWNTPQPFDAPNQLEVFAQSCASLSPTRGDYWARGRPWTFGDAGYTLYNHVLGPNQKSCINGDRVQEGAYTAASQHPSGVNVLLGDGHVAFVATPVSQDVWRAVGSRNGAETVSFSGL